MITVLLAAYNGERYIGKQLDTILGQTVLQIRIIVSDDCSRDATPDILRMYEEAYPNRIQVIRSAVPSGSAADNFFRLLASREADDDYIMLSDQDDAWYPYKAEMLLAEMRRMEDNHGTDAPLLVHSDMSVADESLNVIAESFFAYQKVSPERNRLPQLLVQNNITGGALMMNRALASLLRVKPAVCLMHDSWIGLVASCFGFIGWVDRPLYLYRQHDTNALGAEKGDNLRSYWARVRDGRQARDNYNRMFGQARCLRELFGDRLSPGQKELLEAFERLPAMGWLGRGRTALRYGFTKNSLWRTLGQLIMMGE